MWVLLFCCATISVILQTLDAWAQARPFYEDKTIRVVDYGTAGGGSDLLARLVARHLPRQIPGNPQFVVQITVMVSGFRIALSFQLLR